MARKRDTTDEELALWQRATRQVTPLSRRSAAPPVAGKRTPRASAPKPASPARRTAPGPLEPRLKRRLARGLVAVDARIDLHGKRQSEAHRQLIRFVETCRARGHRSVLVVTGKGRSGEGTGVLRRLVPLWLAQDPLAAHVVAVAPAHARHGGDGALYLRLKAALKE